MPPPSTREIRTLDFAPDFKMIVNLAIEGNDEAARGRDHRLMSGRAEVEDGQAPVNQPCARFAVEPGAPIVGPAMGDSIAHAPKDTFEAIRRKTNANYTGEFRTSLNVLDFAPNAPNNFYIRFSDHANLEF